MSTLSSDSSAPANAATAEPGDIRGLKPLEAFRYPPAYYVGGAVILLVLIGLLVWGIYRWLKRPRSRAAAPALSPEPLDVIILKRLDRTRKEISADTLRRGYFDVSEIFRDYLEGRFKFPASDWTAEEIFSYAKIFLFPPLMEEIRPLLAVTDEVKFAGRAPETDQLLSLIGQAEAFVRKTT